MTPKPQYSMKGFSGLAIAFFFLMILIAAAGEVYCQDITPDDAEVIRKIIAERNFYKSVAEEEARQKEAWKESADSWKALYLAEKDRADTVQGGRIEELRTALEEMKASNAALTTAGELYKQQIAADEQYIKRLESRVESLKRQRWIFGALGFGVGTAFGARVQF